ncbi:MAG: hypothetical protein HYU66_13935, partial [Armatimonadetes bacterium]|nr:hypothetical protein [Armatimonadota bacterium]
MESPPIWRPVPALAVAVLGGVAMAAAAWLGPRGWPIWLVPLAITALAVRSTATPLVVLWAALAVGGAVPRLIEDPGKLSYALSLAEALDLAAMVAGTRWLARRGNAVVLAVGVGCLRAGIELAWSATPLGDEFAWGLHAMACAPLAQAMTLLGVTGLSWLVAAVPASLAVLLCDLNRVGAARVVSLSFALLALCAGIGAGRLEQVPSETVKVAAIGPLPGGEAEMRGLTALAAAEQAEVVVWPENAITLPAVG